MNAELEGLIVSGPLRGASADLRADGRAGAAGAPAAPATWRELAYRFFVGHGPASVRDLARWSSLTQTQAREATEAAAPRLAEVTVTGEPLWCDPAAPEPPATVAYGALLLPLYDELTLTYPALDFPLAAGIRTRPARTCSPGRWCWATRTSASGGGRSAVGRWPVDGGPAAGTATPAEREAVARGRRGAGRVPGAASWTLRSPGEHFRARGRGAGDRGQRSCSARCASRPSRGPSGTRWAAAAPRRAPPQPGRVVAAAGPGRPGRPDRRSPTGAGCLADPDPGGPDGRPRRTGSCAAAPS